MFVFIPLTVTLDPFGILKSHQQRLSPAPLTTLSLSGTLHTLPMMRRNNKTKQIPILKSLRSKTLATRIHRSNLFFQQSLFPLSIHHSIAITTTSYSLKAVENMLSGGGKPKSPTAAASNQKYAVKKLCLTCGESFSKAALPSHQRQ